MLTFKHTMNTDSQIYKDSLDIRRHVFIEEQQVDPSIEIDEKEEQCIHVVGYDGSSRAVATARLYPLSPTALQIQRVAVLKQQRKKHYGRQLMKHIEEIAAQKQINKMILGAQNHALLFYQSLGFHVIGKEYEEAGILHHDMEKSL